MTDNSLLPGTGNLFAGLESPALKFKRRAHTGQPCQMVEDRSIFYNDDLNQRRIPERYFESCR
jgi:hypothetical protein